MSAVALEDEADFVVVGTGAGGATAARVLSGAGCSVVMVEEGPRLKTSERPRGALGAMATAFRDFGTATTEGLAPIPILQGRCVGGATAINSGIIWRLPEDVRLDWIERFGLGDLVDPRGLSEAFDHIERELEIVETQDEILGANSALMGAAAEALGLKGRKMVRNAARCKGTAQCLQGCPGEARQSMDVSYVPRAMASGARLHTLARVDRVWIERGRAVGVLGAVLDPVTLREKGSLRVRARRAVVVSASAIQTPVVLRRSGLRGAVGERFQAHPGAAVVGRFGNPVSMGFGASQGYEVPLRDRGMKLESLTMPPELLATRLPGAGAEWQQRLASLDHYAQWAVQVRMKAHGRVRPRLFGSGSDASVTYRPLEDDMQRLKYGVVTLCRMLFAVGAVEVYPGVAGFPAVLTQASQVQAIEDATLRADQVNMIASHLFGTACAGVDPATTVVGPDLQSHQVRGLYVMDASVFPTNLGVNPQHSIMALTWRAAERLAASSGTTTARAPAGPDTSRAA